MGHLTIKPFVFSIDTCVAVDTKSNPLEKTNVSTRYESCPLAVFLAILRGVGKLCNYGRAVNENAATVSRVWWDVKQPGICLIETYLSASALGWVEMLHATLPSSHNLVRMFLECARDTSSVCGRMLAKRVESWPPSNVHTKTVSAMMNASILTLTRDQKRRLWFDVEQKEASLILWILKSAELQGKASKFVYIEYRALDQHLRKSHPDISEFVDCNWKHKPVETPPPQDPSTPVASHPGAVRPGGNMQSPKTVKQLVPLSETQLAEKKVKRRDTNTSTSSDSGSSYSNCSSPRVEQEAYDFNRKQVGHQSLFHQDLRILKSHNFPVRATTIEREWKHTDWTARKVHQLGLIWDPCFIDGGSVLKPRNFPRHFRVGMKGWESIW